VLDLDGKLLKGICPSLVLAMVVGFALPVNVGAQETVKSQY